MVLPLMTYHTTQGQIGCIWYTAVYNNTMQCNTVQNTYSTVQHSTIQYETVQDNMPQYSTRSYMAHTILHNIIYMHDIYRTVRDRTWLIRYGTTSCTIHTVHDRRYGTTSYTIHTAQYTIVHDSCDTAQDHVEYITFAPSQA